MSTRWAQKLCVDKLEQIARRLPVTEVHGSDGGSFRTLINQRDQSVAGEMRIFLGDGVVKKVVYYAITNDVIGLDSHMVYAFTQPDSLVPHWTFDSVVNGGTYAYHLDLIPRVDLGANLAYMDAVYGPLTETQTAGRAHPTVSEPAIGPRQRAIMSQWMLAYRVDEDEYKNIDPYVQTYLDRWIELVETGLDDAVVASILGPDLAARDAANRAMLFSRDVDFVWDMITPMLGNEQTELMRLNQVTNDLIETVPVSV